jgi:hypothetical protein
MEHHGENPDRGGAEPVESEQDADAGARAPLDAELLEEGTGVPFADALDTGDPGGPGDALGTSRSGPAPATAGQTAAGSGVRVAGLRDGDDDEPPFGGPTPSRDAG